MNDKDLLNYSKITVIRNGQRIEGTLQRLVSNGTFEIWLPLPQTGESVQSIIVTITPQMLARIKTEPDGTLSVILNPENT
jgi:hypothetical protein